MKNLAKVSPIYDGSGKPDIDPITAKKAEALINAPEKEKIKREGNVFHAQDSFGEKSQAEKIKLVADKYMGYCKDIDVLISQRKTAEYQELGKKLVREIDFYLNSLNLADDPETKSSINKLNSVKEYIQTTTNIG
ncbi:MAG: hypothetical protein UT48_C0023G0005 [Parcubacteria group bacterium GW2011_GWE2_39_37]|uniref:Uncharacterized protein n=1 Tax=Candidatus Falkowbacteria bacterium GW2011_GWF2_39_8 TaxID=1618642 RepID=A0A0G0T2C3_9BACT|nr:MAG: hypothetical protein UT48_C0023G0005 [Parcubacteria group bacterium GW2011_GWE2_39_37]KKR31997.1 MAG: hypothetical protein UT64_C0045G0006 [Candidatus Falkowbacteria bacterium GW2011_GWF2_39_8]